MAHYKGTVKGNNSEVSRLGTKKSGMTVVLNGWDAGCEVVVEYKDGYNYFMVYKTGGSSGQKEKALVADWWEKVK